MTAGESPLELGLVIAADQVWLALRGEARRSQARPADAVAQLLAREGASPEAASISAAVPTPWGRPRARELAAQIESSGAALASIVPTAVAAARAADLSEPAGSQSWLVVEAGDEMLCAAVATAADGGAADLADLLDSGAESYRPMAVSALPLADGAWRGGADELAAMLGEALGAARPAGAVLVVWGAQSPDDEAELALAITQAMPTSLRLHTLSPGEVARALAPEPLAAVPVATPSWLRQSIDEEPRRALPKKWALLGAAAAAIAVIAGVSLWAGSSGEPDDAAAGAASGWNAASSTSATPTTPSPAPVEPEPITLGPVVATAPEGWRETPARRSEAADSGRVELSPRLGARQRIVITWNRLEPGATTASVAEALSAKLSRAGGSFGGFAYPATFANRGVISYTERASDGTEVRWFAVVSGQVQANIGCQFDPGEWGRIEQDCADVVEQLRPQGAATSEAP